MQFPQIASTILAFAAIANSATLPVHTEAEFTVNVPGESPISKRQSLLVAGSGGTRTASGSASLQVSVSCGTIYASNFDSAAGGCVMRTSGFFAGCDGCEYRGDFGKFDVTLSAKCGNAGITINGSPGAYEGGDIGEAPPWGRTDCLGVRGGTTYEINICAADGWRLARC